MKNIHVLPTDKPSTPSRLFYKDQELVFSKKYSVFNGVNIYITSDEEIKEGDWCIVTPFGADKFAKVIRFKKENGTLYNLDCNKITLTTDQDLIKDGVQAIDDDFLEWFVKNPSCEEVEVEIESKFDRVDGHYHDVWEIIIQKEEPKQETLEEANFKVLGTKTDTFYNGAKWQQEQNKNKYSKEDLIDAFNEGQALNVRGKLIQGEEWFKQLKDK